jgi:hypothetical protein
MVGEEGGDIGIQKPASRRRYGLRDILVENPIGNGSSVLVRRAALDAAGPFDERLPASPDWDMWLRIARGGAEPVASLTEVLACYRRREGQITGSWQRMERAYRMVIDRVRSEDPELFASASSASLAHRNRYLAYLAYEAGEKRQALRLLGRSFRASPALFLREPRSWVLLGGVLARALLPARAHDALRDGFFRGRAHRHRRRRRPAQSR